MRRYVEFLEPERFVIFLFHGVIRENRSRVRNYTRKHLLLDEFVAVLRDLMAAGSPVSMPEIVAASRGEANLPQRAFAITFDDGFANNATVAAPALDTLGLAATFYVTTRFVDENRPSWIDRIECAVERVPSFRLSLAEAGIDGTYATIDEKTVLLDAIRRYVKGNSAIDPEEFAGNIVRRLGVKTFEPDPELDQKMTWDQVRAMDREPRFTVGGHGHTHRILEYLSDDELGEEIRKSMEMLRGKLGHPVEHYSYPEGLSYCYSDRVIAALKQQGIIAAPTAIEGINRPGDDLFHLKRIMVH